MSLSDQDGVYHNPYARKHMMDFLINLLPCGFPSIEKCGRATNSEIRRWFDRGSVHVNKKPAAWNDAVPDFDEWGSLVLHPRSNRRTTLW